MYIHIDELETLYAYPEEENAIFENDSESINIITQEKNEKAVSFMNFFSNLFTQKKNYLSEIRILIILFFIVFAVSYFFTNAKLVLITINDVFGKEDATTLQIVEENEGHNVAEAEKSQQKKIEELEKDFAALQELRIKEQDLSLSMEEFLDKKQETHMLNYNLLPPINRLIIPDLSIDVPIVDVEVKGGMEFSNGDYDVELMDGVVKYPTTVNPGSIGNSLIFGHSSTERWKHNEYGFVFRNLPRLKVGQKIQIIWRGQLTTYEMIERKVVLPKEVSEYYQEFQEKGESYITLMGCYPIGSSSQRIMVVAKKIGNN